MDKLISKEFINEGNSLMHAKFFKYMACFAYLILSTCFLQLQAVNKYENKRLLIISDIYENHIGGTEKVIAEIKTRLQKLGMTISVVDLSKISTFRIPFTTEERFPCPWRIKKEMSKIIIDFCPDYILIVPLGIMSFAAGEYCFDNNIPFTIFYSVRMPELSKTLLGIPMCFVRYFINSFLSKAKNILVPTLSFRDELIEQGFKNVITWPHGVDLQSFKTPTSQEKEQATEKCNLHNTSRPFYLFVGHLSKAKNLEAFLNLDLPGTKILVGDENIGFSLNNLRKRYPDVIFPGPKIGNELLNYYQCADIFLFPSKADSFGLVMLEALASGLPIVGFNTSGPRDVVPNGSGVSYLANNNLELQKMALQAWSDLESGKVTAQQCREYAQHFSWDNAVEQLLENLVQIEVLPENNGSCCCC